MSIRKINILIWWTAFLLLIFLFACSGNEKQIQIKEKESIMGIQITSSVFKEGEPIPSKYTCDGEDISPPLKWSSLPEGTKSLALISDDPDAPVGTWVHWVIYNIPPTVTELEEGIPTDKELPSGAKQGMNDFKKIGYGGPCPPSGTHRYFFKLYALDSELNLEPRATKKDVLKAMEGHILEMGQLMGTYSRK